MTEEELTKERGVYFAIFRKDARNILDEIDPADRAAALDAVLFWIAGRDEPMVKGTPAFVFKTLKERHLGGLDARNKKAKAGSVTSRAKAEAVRANGKLGGRPTKPNGNLTKPNGNLTKPNGNLTKPNGNLTKPNQTITIQNDTIQNGGGGITASASMQPNAAAVSDIEKLIDDTAARLGDKFPNRETWRNFIAVHGSGEFSRLAEQAKGKARTNPGPVLSQLIAAYSPGAAKAERDRAQAEQVQRQAKAAAAWRKDKLCAERCANSTGTGCARGVKLPPSANRQPPQDCPHFVALAEGGAA